jgi:hypothetical protein
MRREDLVDLFGRIPEVEHTKIMLILKTGLGLNIDTLFRFETHYVVIRGREMGQTDEARGYFVPYDEIQMLKWEKTVQLSEIANLFGAQPPKVAQPTPQAATNPTTTPAPAAPLRSAPVDPAEIARQNLLERIRAAKSIGAKR